MKMKTKLMIAAGTAVTAAGGYYGLCELAYNRFLRRGPKNFVNPELEPLDEDERQQRYKDSAELQEWFSRSQVSDLTLTAADGLRLHATAIENQKQDKRWAILVHGYGMDGLDLLNRARHFDEQGFSVLLPDLRGHGLSEGGYIGMGWPDRLDLKGWIDRISADHPGCHIVLYGLSMGASAVMMTCGELTESPVVCAVEDCGYSSVAAIAEVQLRHTYHAAAPAMLIGLNTLAKMRCGYSLYDADCRRSLENNTIPMMFIHGEDDDFVPYDMVFENYYACTGPRELFTVPSAGHAQAHHNPSYYGRVFRFINRFMPDDGQ